MSTEERRSYRSPARDESARRTRLAIIEAAHRLFVGLGYAATSMRAIAETAGVAESTLYHVFGDKPTLLWALVEHVVGEGEDLERQGVQLIEEIRETAHPHDRLRIIAHWSRGTYERGIAQVEAVIEEASRSDPSVAALAERAAGERYLFTRRLADVVSEVLPPTPSSQLDQIAQFIWAVDSSPVYRMLVEDQGWSPDEFEEWIYHFYSSLLPTTVDEESDNRD